MNSEARGNHRTGLKLHVLSGGRLSVNKALFAPGRDDGAQIVIPVLHFPIRHPQRIVLFDTGCHPAVAADPAGRRQIDVGLHGVIHCCHAALPRMTEQKGGRIINLAGDSARVGEVRLSITAAARAGVLALAKTLAKELGRYDITVNALALGVVEGGHRDAAWFEANREKIAPLYPLRRLSRPSDVAPLVAFPASDLAGPRAKWPA